MTSTTLNNTFSAICCCIIGVFLVLGAKAIIDNTPIHTSSIGHTQELWSYDITSDKVRIVDVDLSEEDCEREVKRHTSYGPVHLEWGCGMDSQDPHYAQFLIDNPMYEIDMTDADRSVRLKLHGRNK